MHITGMVVNVSRFLVELLNYKFIGKQFCCCDSVFQIFKNQISVLCPYFCNFHFQPVLRVLSVWISELNLIFFRSWVASTPYHCFKACMTPSCLLHRINVYLYFLYFFTMSCVPIPPCAENSKSQAPSNLHEWRLNLNSIHLLWKIWKSVLQGECEFSNAPILIYDFLNRFISEGVNILLGSTKWT